MRQLLKDIRRNPLLWLLAFVPVVQIHAAITNGARTS
jgi:hypothetical protein